MTETEVIIANLTENIRNTLHEGAASFANAMRLKELHATGAKLSKDGNQWCMLLGENLQEGCAGFGDSPWKAAIDFEQEYFGRKNPSQTPAPAGPEGEESPAGTLKDK